VSVSKLHCHLHHPPALRFQVLLLYRKGNCVQIFASIIYAILWICLCSAKAAAIVVLRYLTQLALELQETKVVAPFVGFTDAGHTNTSVVNR